MNINIYYGGRGLLDDPTLYVIDKMEAVLKELRVKVERYNIFEHKNEIATLPQTFKEADGIILATTVEWLGIGGYLTVQAIGAGIGNARVDRITDNFKSVLYIGDEVDAGNDQRISQLCGHAIHTHDVKEASVVLKLLKD